MLGIIFLIIMFLSSFINFKQIDENISASLEDYSAYSNLSRPKIDSYTDMIMLNMIAFHDENIIEKALLGKYSYASNNLPEVNVKNTLNNTYSKVENYGRHWNGWMLFVKIFLIFFKYQTILKILFVIEIILLIILLYFSLKKIDKRFTIILLLAFLLLPIYRMGTCIQFACITIPTLIFCIIIVNNLDNSKFDYSKFFFINGAIITFLNFLNFTLISLVYPLIILIYYDIVKDREKYKNHIKKLIISCIYWFLGYSILWILKWLIGTLFFGFTFIEEAFLNVENRLGFISSFYLSDVLYMNIQEFISYKINFFTVLLTILFLIIFYIKNFKNKLKITLPFLLIAIIPFVWYMVLKNHSIIHYWMTYRLLCITNFSILTGILTISKDINYKLEKFSKDDYLILFIFFTFVLFHSFPLVLLVINVIILFKDKKMKFVNILNTCVIIFSIMLFSIKTLSQVSQNSKNKKNIYQIEMDEKINFYSKIYIKKHPNDINKKITMKKIIDNMDDVYDSDTVFLLQCHGYVIINEKLEVNTFCNK